MKKLFSLALSVLLVSSAQAQSLFESFQPGTYLLADSRRKQYQGRLKVHVDRLVIKDDQGSVVRYQPEEVYYVKTADNKRYMPANSFLLRGRTIKPSLVEVLDSGQVMLLYYAQLHGSGMEGGSGSTIVYLLQRADEEAPVALPAEGIVGKKFNEALLPYAEARPDLVKLLTAKRVTTFNLADFIHALNTGQPMNMTVPTVY